MRGTDETSGSLFSYVDLEARIPARHPLRKIRQVVNEALASLDPAGTADPGELDPDPVLGPLRAAVDGADAV